MIERIVNLYKKYEEIVNYVVVGGITTVVSIGIKWLLLFTILNPKNADELQVAVIISWIGAVLFAYVANRIIVFKSKNTNIINEFVKFIGSRLTTLLLEMFIMWFFITLLGMNTKIWVIIWTLVAQVFIMVFNYILSKLFVFKRKNK